MYDDDRDTFDYTLLLLLFSVVIVIYLLTSDVKPAAPYNDSRHTSTYIEDNDTNVCIGYCPDR